MTAGIACAVMLGLIAAPDALASGDWTYLSSGSPSSSPGPDIQLTWNDVSPGNPPQYEVFTLPVSFDPNSVWCATQDGHDAGVIVGQPDGNPNEFECNFGAYPSSGAGAAGVTTTTPMPCDAMIQQKFSWDGSTFYPWDDLTPTDCGGGSSPPGSGSGPPGSGGSSSPSVNVSAKSSTKAQGATVLVDPGIRATCPVGGPACSADVSASARVATSAAAKTVKVVIGQAHLTIPAGKTAKLTFKLNSRGAKLLRKLKTLRVTVTVTGRVTGNMPVTTTKQITTKLPAAKRGH